MAKRKSIFKRILIFLFVILFLAALAVGGFAASIYYQVLDAEKVEWVNEKIGLYKLPIVGYDGEFEYFKVPPGVVWPEPEPEPEPEPAPEETTVAKAPPPPPATVAEPKKSREVKISQKDIEEQTKLREAAEKKRITKLANIYNSMKPEEAAKALDGVQLDTVSLILQRMDEDTAAQILAKMDPLLAAQITQMIFDGNQRRL